MSWLTDLGTYLQTQGAGTIGTTMFYGGLPETVTDCIALLEQPGLRQQNSASGDMTLIKPEFGVRVRNLSGSTAKSKAESIHALLNMKVNSTIGSTYFKRIQAISEPSIISKSLTDGTIYTINFSLEISK